MKNPIDWIIERFDPISGLRRASARNALRGFEAASRSRRTDGWRTTSGDANTEIRQGQQLLRDRARAMRRDNPYGERGVSAISANVVGYGIVPDPQGRKRQKRKALDMWRLWAETTDCDFHGSGDFYAMQNLAMQSIVESGEVIILRVWTPGVNALNFQLQLLEADYLDSQRNTVLGTGGYIEAGIEYEESGRVVAYWLYPQHPGGAIRSMHSGTVSVRTPANDVAHIFLRKRPGQSRGYSWLAPVMLRMRNFEEMEDAVIEQAKIAACFAAIIQTPDIGGGVNPGAKQTMMIDRMEPGIIERAAPGETVTFGTPPTFNGYQPYSLQSLRAFSVGLGLPYEVLSGDLSGVSFTSGRMGWLEFGRNIDVWRQHMIIPQMCKRVWGWFNEAAALSPLGWDEPVLANWVAPRRDLIDPTAEIESLKAEMRIGAISYTGMLKERGVTDTDAHIAQIAEDYARIDANGLVLDSDPRKVSAAGLTQARPGGTVLPPTDIAPEQQADTLSENQGAT